MATPTAEELEARRAGVFTAVRGGQRTWTRPGGVSITVSNIQRQTLNGCPVVSIDLLVTRNGNTIYDDRLNFPNPPLNVRNADGTSTFNPLQAMRIVLEQEVERATQGFRVARIMRDASGNLLGDTLVSFATNDGYIQSSHTNAATARAGSALAVTTTTPMTVMAVLFDDSPSDLYGFRTSYFTFDTSSLGGSATISGSVLSLAGEGTAESDLDNANLEAAYYSYGAGNPTTADWIPGANWAALTDVGVFDIGSWNQTSNTYNNFSDAGNYASINQTGDTQIAVATSLLPSGSLTVTGAFPGGNYVEFHASEAAGTTGDPKLTITYTTQVDVTVNSVTATASAAAALPTPTVSIPSAVATATAQAEVPTVDSGVLDATVNSEAATATAAAQTPTPTISPDSAAATATAAAHEPDIQAEGNVTVNSEAATAAAAATAPTPSVAPDSEMATGTAEAETPTPSVAPDVVTATSTAAAGIPGTSISQPTPTATATAAALSPTATIAVDGVTATATALATIPGLSISQPTPAATATAAAHTPLPTILLTSATATATAQAIAPTVFIIPGPAEIDIEIEKAYRVRLHLPNVADAEIEVGRAYELTFKEITPAHALELGIGNTYALEITMSNETCYVGTAETVTATFTSVSSGAKVDPTTVTAGVRSEGGTLTEYVYNTDPEVVRDSTGVYHINVTPDSDGKWTVAFKGTGTAVVVNQDTFTAIPSIFD